MSNLAALNSAIIALCVGVSPLADYAECQTFVDGVVATSWWCAAYPHCVRAEVVDAQRFASATTTTETDADALCCADPANQLYVIHPRSELGRRPPVLLHELAHCAVPESQIRSEAHGREFVAALADLIQRVLGPAADATFQRAIEAFAIPTFDVKEFDEFLRFQKELLAPS